MAVFTGAALAIGAAIASTTFATVATAAVAVSAAIGVAGLAVTAVGLVTKNQDLLKVGKIMGYVGLAGGLAGGAIGGFGAMSAGGSFVEGAADAFAGASQFLKEGWDSGVGQLFSSDAGAKVAGPLGADGITGQAQSTSIGNAPPPSSGAPVGSGGPTAGPTDMSTALNNPPADVLASQQAAMGPGSPVSQVPVAPAVPNPLPAYGGHSAIPIPGAAGAPGAPSGIADFFGKMPDWSKYAMMTTAGQGISGLASGYFTGAAAEEQLKQRQLENQQTQNQIQLLNKQGSYAPLLTFKRPTGLAQGGA